MDTIYLAIGCYGHNFIKAHSYGTAGKHLHDLAKKNIINYNMYIIIPWGSVHLLTNY